jgi:starvation-inducible DNA-binding protein
MTRKNSLDTGLATLLADYQVHYQKLRGYHWNVTGPMFFGLHAQFEALYTDAAEKVDLLAERIAARGGRPPATLAQHLELARIREDATAPAAHDMVRNVVGDLEHLIGASQELSAVATECGDATTANLLDGFADGHEKTAWMFRAFLQG